MSFNKWMEYFNFLKIFNIKHWILWCNIYNIGWSYVFNWFHFVFFRFKKEIFSFYFSFFLHFRNTISLYCNLFLFISLIDFILFILLLEAKK